MDTHEKPAFAKLLTGMAAVHDKILSKAVVEIYWQSLARFAFADVQRALQAHIDNPDGGQFFPKPADVIRLLEGSGHSKASSAWAKVEKAISQIGSYTSVVFDDALIHAVIEDMGGWVRLCQTTIDQLKFSGIEFQKRYQVFLTKTPERYPKVLVSIIQRDNTCDGYKVPPPTFIGDKQQARQVMSGGGGNSLTVHEPRRKEATVVSLANYLPKKVTS